MAGIVNAYCQTRINIRPDTLAVFQSFTFDERNADRLDPSDSGLVVFVVIALLVSTTPLFYPSSDDICNIRYSVIKWLKHQMLPF